MTEIGERIGALLGSEGEEVRFLGYGVYVGREVPPNNMGWLAQFLNEAQIENPKLVLDNDMIVWGCMCWWGPEEKIKSQIAEYINSGYKIIQVTPEELEANLSDDSEQLEKDFEYNDKGEKVCLMCGNPMIDGKCVLATDPDWDVAEVIYEEYHEVISNGTYFRLPELNPCGRKHVCSKYDTDDCDMDCPKFVAYDLHTYYEEGDGL